MVPLLMDREVILPCREEDNVKLGEMNASSIIMK